MAHYHANPPFGFSVGVVIMKNESATTSCTVLKEQDLKNSTDWGTSFCDVCLITKCQLQAGCVNVA